jgi:hypothetical protein
MRLGGWQRLGIVVSVIWIAGAAWSQHQTDLDEAMSAAASAKGRCLATNPNDPAKCDAVADVIRELAMSDDKSSVALLAFGVPAMAWPTVYVVAAVARWVRVGFRRNSN